MQPEPEPLRSTYTTAATYPTGAAAYFLAVEMLGVTFLVTPLFFGGNLLVTATQRRRLLVPAVLLGCWGTAVILLDRGLLPANRTPAVYIIALGVAAPILLLRRRSVAARISLESAAVVMTVAGLALYSSYDVAAFARGWLWALLLALNAVGLLLAARWRQRHACRQAQPKGVDLASANDFHRVARADQAGAQHGGVNAGAVAEFGGDGPEHGRVVGSRIGVEVDHHAALVGLGDGQAQVGADSEHLAGPLGLRDRCCIRLQVEVGPKAARIDVAAGAGADRGGRVQAEERHLADVVIAAVIAQQKQRGT
jgi:hypothetical protein